MGTNLHSVWDYYILGSGREPGPAPDYADRLDALPWPPDVGADHRPMAWAGESCRLVDARHAVSDRTHAGSQPISTRSGRWPNNACARPAYRLAQLLDDTLATRRATEVHRHATPTSQPFHHAATGTWSYVVADPATRAAAIIDPVLDFDAKSGRTAHAVGAGAARPRARARPRRAVDAGNPRPRRPSQRRALAARRSWPRRALAHRRRHPRRAAQLSRRSSTSATHSRVDGSQFDHLFADGDTFRASATLAAQVIAVPGHTSDSVAYLIGDALFTGDTLFMPDGGTARCDFPGGDAAHAVPVDPAPVRTARRHPRVRLPRLRPGRPRRSRCETTIGAQKRDNIHVRDGVERSRVRRACARRATPRLPMPALILPAVQVNIRAGRMPPPSANGVRYLSIPLDRV